VSSVVEHNICKHTTLAPLATTSRSVGTEVSVHSTDEMRAGEISAISLRHSVARDRRMDNEMRRELYTH
jgi:hypothetical protein